MLNPITPHICSEISKELNIIEIQNEKSWPLVNENFIKDDKNLIIIQINGKVRKKIEVSDDISQKDLEKHILSLDEIIKYTKNCKVKKIIYIKGKLVNIVI